MAIFILCNGKQRHEKIVPLNWGHTAKKTKSQRLDTTIAILTHNVATYSGSILDWCYQQTGHERGGVPGTLFILGELLTIDGLSERRILVFSGIPTAELIQTMGTQTTLMKLSE